MSSTIVVPELSESVTEARVGRWQKKEGDRVSTGDVLVELETDKVDLEVGAESSGVLAKILHEEGDEVHVGDELAVIEPGETNGDAPDAVEDAEPHDETDEKASESASDAKSAEAKSPPKKSKDRKKGKRRKDEQGDDEPSKGEQSEDEPSNDEDSNDEEKVAETADGERPEATAEKRRSKPASPSARRLARERDVDLQTIGRGVERDRITREDVESFVDERKRRQDESPAAEGGQESSRDGRREELVRMSGRRRTIARRLVEAQRNAAILTTFNEVDMSALMALRARHQESFVERHGSRLGIVSFFVRASIGALREFPELNAEVRGESILVKHYYDIGVAVGAPEGLVVPVVRDADRLSLAAIETRIKDLAARATNGRLTPEDLAGGTFTITNGGVFGSLLSTPILNPPQVGILGLHKIEDRPLAVDGRVQIRPMMYVALSYDHRVVDGSGAVGFLARVKELVELPEKLLLEG